MMRRYFLAGLAVLLPVGATLYVLTYLFNFLDGLSSVLINRIFGLHIPGLGLLLTLTVIFLVGAIASNIFGRKIVASGERLLEMVPVVRPVYKTLKQIVQAFVQQEKGTFQRVVLFEYPRQGCYALGFLTGVTQGEVQEKTAQELVNVFLPTTPNPTSGFLLLLPKNEVIPLDMSVEDGIKMIISGGVAVPAQDGKVLQPYQRRR